MNPIKTIAPVTHDFAQRQIIVHPVQRSREQLSAMTDAQQQEEQRQADAIVASMLPEGHRLVTGAVLGFEGTGPRSRLTRQKSGPVVRVICVTVARTDARHSHVDFMGRPVVPTLTIAK